MDKERKKQLKKLGKAEVERQSQELNARLNEANPAALNDPTWIANYRVGSAREKWLKKKLPTLHNKRLNKLFVVNPYESEGWYASEEHYIQCLDCGSALPSVGYVKQIEYTGCKCKNIFRWRFLRWHRSVIKRPDRVIPIKLIGRG